MSDVCASYKPIDTGIVKPSVPDNGPVKTPGVGSNWFNNSNVNQSFAEQIANQTQDAVDKIRSTAGNKSGALLSYSSFAALCLSIGSLMFI